MSKSVDAIILCAVKNEFESIKLILREAVKDENPIDDLTYLKGMAGGYSCIAVLTGPNMENCTKNLFRVLNRYDTRLVLMFGAAGAINPKLKVGTVTMPSCVIRYGSSGFENRTEGEILLPNRGIEKLSGIFITKAGTSPYFINSNKLKNKIFKELQIDTTDCETYYAAEVCRERSILFSAVRCITDNAGPWASAIYFLRSWKVLNKGAQEVYRIINALMEKNKMEAGEG